MVRIIIIILAIVALSLGLMSLQSQSVSLDITCDDFVQQQGAISENVLVDNWADYLIVSLCSNPTTGFKWELTEISDPLVLEYKNSEYVSPEAANTVGGAGKEVWTFRPLRPGESTLTMEYSQPWEGGEKGEWTFVLTATVK